MRGVTKLGLALILILGLSILGLLLELLYLLRHRHRRRSRRRRRGSVAGDPELNDSVGESSDWPPLSYSPKWLLLLHALCWKNQSRVEPTSSAVTLSTSSAAAKPQPPPPPCAGEEEEEEYDIARWREMCMGPSRDLYTIEEEELEASSGEDEDAEDDAEDVEGTTAFTTPCASPAFYTPSSSPSRPPEAGDAEAASAAVELQSE